MWKCNDSDVGVPSKDRITDHRIKQSWSNIEKIFAGNIEPILEACAKGTVWDAEEQLTSDN